MFRTRTALLSAAIAITGCRQARVPSTAIQPIPKEPANDTSVRSTGPWFLTPSHGPQEYHSISRTTIRELSIPAIHQNSTEFITDFSISLDQARSSLEISG